MLARKVLVGHTPALACKAAYRPFFREACDQAIHGAFTDPAVRQGLCQLSGGKGALGMARKVVEQKTFLFGLISVHRVAYLLSGDCVADAVLMV